MTTVCLSLAALKAIDAANVGLEEDVLPDRLQEALLRLAASPVTTTSLLQLGVMEDVPVSVHDLVVVEERGRGGAGVDSTVRRLLDHLEGGSKNVKVVIELVSDLEEAQLSTVVSQGWRSLAGGRGDELKREFVIAMSATRASALSVCSEVLLPLLLSEDSFDETLRILGPTLAWLEASVTDCLLVPLLLNQLSAERCKELVSCLSELQRSQLVLGLSSQLATFPLHDHLYTLLTLLEAPPLDPSAVASVVNLLTASVDSSSDSRPMGKLILALIASLSVSTPRHTINQVANLTSRFRGPLRFRHKQELNRLLKQISST